MMNAKLRLLIVTGLLATSTAAGAQSGRGAASEVTLQIVARGVVTSAADKVTVSVGIPGKGTTAAAASAAADAKLASVTRALAAVGVAGDAITVQPTGGGLLGMMSGIGDMTTVDVGDGTPEKSTVRTVQIRLPDVAKLQQVRDVLAAQDIAGIGAPELALTDDRAARAAAITDAVTKARGEADTYASAVGLRVLRITRVSNQSPQLFDMNQLDVLKRMTNLGGARDVTTDATVAIDFVMGPR